MKYLSFVTMSWTRKYPTLFWLAALGYFFLLFYNLDRIPVAWTDESQYIDPAANYVYQGSFSSKLYNYETSPELYAMSLPFIQFVHCITLNWLEPVSLYSMRFPMALFALLTFMVFLLYNRQQGYGKWLGSLLIFLFFFDKGVYEMIRSGRGEIFVAFFSILGIYWFYNKYYLLCVLSTSILLLTHPAAWPLSLLLFLFAFFKEQSWRKKLTFPILVLVPSFLWLNFIDFRWDILAEQLLGQGEAHSPVHSQGNALTNFLWYRFMPYWQSQPYLVVLRYMALFFSIRAVIKGNFKSLPFLETAYLSTELFFSLLLATHHRYNVILVLFIILIMAKYTQFFKVFQWKKAPWFVGLLLPLVTFPFLSRNALAVAERESRDPTLFLAWLDKQLPKQEKQCLMGCDLGLYHAYRNPNTEFYVMIYPTHIDWDKHQRFYFLLYEQKETELEELAQYQVKDSKLGQWIHQWRPETGTYNGMRLYFTDKQDIAKEIVAKRLKK